jgi:hypothetical protein
VQDFGHFGIAIGLDAAARRSLGVRHDPNVVRTWKVEVALDELRLSDVELARLARGRRSFACEVESLDEKLDEIDELPVIGFAYRRLFKEIADRRLEIMGALQNRRDVRILASQYGQFANGESTAMARIVFSDTPPDDLPQPLHPFFEIATCH